ncbi:MAG: hypothetical protein BWY85_00269 [Firmicutes bacterium ADurb.Bin506]|nr:MAG: hypothetical protein BWY85_00269 [Firmicutes bacterium ADurb.Bin506]
MKIKSSKPAILKAAPPAESRFQSDVRLLVELDAEIGNVERAANPPEGASTILGALSPGLSGMLPIAAKQAQKKLDLLQRLRARLGELIEKEHEHE